MRDQLRKQPLMLIPLGILVLFAVLLLSSLFGGGSNKHSVLPKQPVATAPTTSSTVTIPPATTTPTTPTTTTPTTPTTTTKSTGPQVSFLLPPADLKVATASIHALLSTAKQLEQYYVVHSNSYIAAQSTINFSPSPKTAKEFFLTFFDGNHFIVCDYAPHIKANKYVCLKQYLTGDAAVQTFVDGPTLKAAVATAVKALPPNNAPVCSATVQTNCLPAPTTAPTTPAPVKPKPTKTPTAPKPPRVTNTKAAGGTAAP